MRVEYDPIANAAYIRMRETEIVESEEVADGVICDFDEQNKIVGVEILSIKQRSPTQIKNIIFPFDEQDKQNLKELFSIFELAF
ncbi:DUF2283 domain-containing protein [Pseudanabaena sp. Chao 1811]|uniref:DUF2283 domain-containing protein n=1 Tax=Pseudanabaena sp. Chao 1811 TaxID=2963092 RepID=UPI0022F384F7|nr:DUF2283 domain-containing protein [Pseudanabaena sp. Chao 1811]